MCIICDYIKFCEFRWIKSRSSKYYSLGADRRFIGLCKLEVCFNCRSGSTFSREMSVLQRRLCRILDRISRKTWHQRLIFCVVCRILECLGISFNSFLRLFFLAAPRSRPTRRGQSGPHRGAHSTCELILWNAC